MGRFAVVRRVQRLVNRLLVFVGVHLAAPPGVAILETTGRRSGRPRHTPVGNGLAKGTNTFWLVAEYGRRAQYVRNIEADPRVRVRIGRRWRTGTAHVL